MGYFAWGLLAGWISSLVIGAVAAVYAYRRYRRLASSVRQSQRLAELGTLTGGLAHEIKNPLSTVQLNLQLLREDLLPDNPAYSRIINRLKTVQNETSRLKDILDDFLRYAGHIELEKKPVDLNELLEELVDFFSPQAQAHHAQLRLRRSDGPLIVPVDAKLIKQAILNLMINGLQAMNGQEGELILTASKASDQAVIDIIDTGRGIDPETIGRIFHAYYSTRKGGTGLGLAMTRRIIVEHGGRIDVKSEPGKGTDFTLRLPM